MLSKDKVLETLLELKKWCDSARYTDRPISDDERKCYSSGVGYCTKIIEEIESGSLDAPVSGEYNRALDDVLKIINLILLFVGDPSAYLIAFHDALMVKIESLRKPEFSEAKNPTATQLILRRLTNSECRDNEDLKDVVKAELELLEYDGLYTGDCGCPIADLMPCVEFCPDNCRAGYKRLTEDLVGGKAIWRIGPEKMEFSEEESGDL